MFSNMSHSEVIFILTMIFCLGYLLGVLCSKEKDPKKLDESDVTLAKAVRVQTSEIKKQNDHHREENK